MIAIVRASSADAPALKRLLEAAYRGDAARRGWNHEADILDGERITEKELDGLLADAEVTMLVARDGEALVGSVAVTMLTSLDERDLARTGVTGAAHDQVMRLAELAHAAGLDGVVCSGHEVKAVHAQWRDGFFVVPGLRLPDHGVGDQKRVVTPRQARDDGASVLVIGRPISRADDPLAAAIAIEATL